MWCPLLSKGVRLMLFEGIDTKEQQIICSSLSKKRLAVMEMSDRHFLIH
jgi:hypothetical protein